MKLQFNYFIISLVIFSFSCEEKTPTPQTEQNCFEVTDNFNDSPALKSTWQFLGFVNKLTGEEVCFPAGLENITLSFDAYNRVNITSLCNTYPGHYLLNGPSKLKIGDVLFRLNECISDTSKKWERECLQNLEETTGFEITGDILTLHTNASYDLKFRYEGENTIETPTCFNIENNVKDVDLTRKWVFLGYIDDGYHCKPDIDFEMNLEFTNTDSIYGQAGNFGFGTYQLFEHDSIDLKFSTYAMYFINDTIRYWDNLFLDNLYDIGWYDIQGRKLKLYNSEMHSLVFVSEE